MRCASSQTVPLSVLPYLVPSGLSDERSGEPVGLVATDLADELDPHGDVAPLVAATDLQFAAVVLVQAQEVVGLEEHVAELGVADALVRSLEARLDRLLAHHLVDREVLAHVAQELEGGECGQPVGVVEQQGPVEIEELAQLGPDPLEVGLDGLEVEELALTLLAARVADHGGAPAGERDGAVPAFLEAAQRAELEEIAHVEAVGARVEAGVERDGGARVIEALRQIGVGHLVDQAAEGEVLRQGGHAFDAAIRR